MQGKGHDLPRTPSVGMHAQQSLKRDLSRFHREDVARGRPKGEQSALCEQAISIRCQHQYHSGIHCSIVLIELHSTHHPLSAGPAKEGWITPTLTPFEGTETSLQGVYPKPIRCHSHHSTTGVEVAVPGKSRLCSLSLSTTHTYSLAGNRFTTHLPFFS